MGRFNQGQHDVVILPTFAHVETWRKRGASSQEAGLFAQIATTFDAWISDLWELHGDGRAIIGDMQRAIAMQAAFADMPPDFDTPGMAPLAASCMREAAGCTTFEEALATTRNGQAPTGISPREEAFLGALARYEREIEGLGLVESGYAAMAIARHCNEVFGRQLSILMPDAPPLSHVQREFFEACPQLDLTMQAATGMDGIEPAPEGLELRFMFPSGKLAEPGLIADALIACAESGDAIVVCKDPIDMAARTQHRLSATGLRVHVQARKPFAQTDFGAAFLAMWRCLNVDPWNPALLSDIALSPFSGFSQADAFKIDASLRADRIARREDALATLRAASEPFSRLEELASDPDADVLLGTFEQMAQSCANRSPAWRVEQLSAISALREAMSAARHMHAGVDACASALERSSVPVCASVDGDRGTVLFTTQALASCMEAGSVATLIAADLTSEDYPVADKDDAASTLLAKLGMQPVESALSRARRRFSAMCSLPSRNLVIMRPLGNADADDTYPAIVLEEFVDAYRPDASATDDIDNAYRLPEPMQRGLAERGEELLYANALAIEEHGVQHAAAHVPAQSMGDLSSCDARLVMPTRRDGKGRKIERLCPAPSQIEAYLECPYQWFAMRRLRISELDEGFGPLERGTFAHTALETFYRMFQEAGHAKVRTDNLECARTLMRDITGNLVQAQFSQDPANGRLVYANELERREVEALCKQLVDYLDYEMQLLPTFHPGFLECEIDAGQGVEYAGHAFTGKVDRIDVDERGNAVIVDYKGSVNAEHEIAGKTASHAGKVQTRIYAQAVKRALGLNVVGALYVSYGRKHAMAGAYDPRMLETAHLPGMSLDKCACRASGSASEVPPDAPPEGPAFSDLTFDEMLDETERIVGDAIERMHAGYVEPDPSNPNACAYCPVLACPKRGA